QAEIRDLRHPFLHEGTRRNTQRSTRREIAVEGFSLAFFRSLRGGTLEQDIGRLEVAVEDAPGMDKLDGLRQGRDELGRLARTNRLCLLLEPYRQARPRAILRGEITPWFAPRHPHHQRQLPPGRGGRAQP